MKRRLAIAIAIGLLAVSSPVRANILNLDASSAGDFSFQGIPPNRIATTIANPLLGSGNLMGDPNLGAYILAPPAPNTFVSGPASVTGDFSLPNVKEALVY